MHTDSTNNTDNGLSIPDKDRMLIGISSCLLGEKVRYNAGHKHHSYITETLGQFFSFRSFCPEMAIGLGAPRETLRLVRAGPELRCIGTQTDTLDVTEALQENAQQQHSWHQELCGYILKKDSPSCGMERVKVYHQGQADRSGTGIYAAILKQNFPLLPIEEEGRLGDAVLRENFIKRVYLYRHWRDLQEQACGLKELTAFHAAYKYVLLSHDQTRTRQLGTRLGSAANEPIAAVRQWYAAELMSILGIPASRNNHANVLQHLQGFLKNDLDKADKQELGELISAYHQGLLPLIVPISLLRHHFRRHPKPWVQNCKYLAPHPAELMLLNTL